MVRKLSEVSEVELRIEFRSVSESYRHISIHKLNKIMYRKDITEYIPFVKLLFCEKLPILNECKLNLLTWVYKGNRLTIVSNSYIPNYQLRKAKIDDIQMNLV